ncbi:chromate transporter [bacterium]|nr:chromate transporter [bacterium]
MLKLYFLLCYEFAQIGIFAIGGGYAAIPFLFHIQDKYNWFSIEELTNMIAISNITPGPIGINMATYAGFKTAGILGSTVSTFSMLIVPFIITILITKLFSKLQNNDTIKNLFMGLRPAACALLLSIGISLLFTELFNTKEINFESIDIKQFGLFIVLLISMSFFKKNPLITILLGAIGGVILNYFI